MHHQSVPGLLIQLLQVLLDLPDLSHHVVIIRVELFDLPEISQALEIVGEFLVALASAEVALEVAGVVAEGLCAVT